MEKFRRRPQPGIVQGFVWGGDVHAFVQWLESLRLDYWLVKYEAGKAGCKLWFHANREQTGMEPARGDVIVLENGALNYWTPECFEAAFEAVEE